MEPPRTGRSAPVPRTAASGCTSATSSTSTPGCPWALRADPLSSRRNRAVEHLRAVDPVMRRLVQEHGPLSVAQRRRDRGSEAYGALLRSIVGQQLSTKAARTIYQRMLEIFDGEVPSPRQL